MKIDNSSIRKLIKRYMDGLTTNEEEKQLADFFANGEIPNDLMPYRDMFDMIATPTNSPSTEDVDNYFAHNGIMKEEIKHQLQRECTGPYRNMGKYHAAIRDAQCDV